MAVKELIGAGIGFTPGGTKFLITRGLSIGASQEDLTKGVDVSKMYESVYKTIEYILGPQVGIYAAYQNISAPQADSVLGAPQNPYIVINEIPSSKSLGNPDSKQWQVFSGIEGRQELKDDYQAVYEIHQVGGRGELLQKLKAHLWFDTVVAFMKNNGVSNLSAGETIPMYNEITNQFGPDCMAEFIFASVYRSEETFNKITDVQTSVDT
jgi:hypothetical protein